MHVEAIPQPLLHLAANFAIASLAVATRHKVRREVVAQVLEDGSALGQNNGLREQGSSDSNDWRFTQRVDGFQFRRCKLVGLTLVDLDIVGGCFGAFFEEPDDALGAGFLEPGRGWLGCGG